MTAYALRLRLLPVFTHALLSLALLALPPSIAAQTQKLRFKNIKDMIGWVKAKGACEETKGTKKCQIRIELPNEERSEPKGKAVWQVWAVIDLTEFHAEARRYFGVYVVKSRTVVLLPSTPSSTMRSIKRSRYGLGPDGKVSDAAIETILELPSGEYLLDQEMLLAPGNAFMHGEGVSDSVILQCQLGIAWKYRRDNAIGVQC